MSTGHDSYGAGEDWRVGNNDDLVLAVAMACWHTEQAHGDRAEAGGFAVDWTTVEERAIDERRTGRGPSGRR